MTNFGLAINWLIFLQTLRYPQKLIILALVISKNWFHEDRNTDQRKILEPFLVEKMVAVLFQNTDRILKL